MRRTPIAAAALALGLALAPGCGGDCTPHDHKVCFDGDRYWADSCDVRETIAEECACGCDYPTGTCLSCQDLVTMTLRITDACDDGMVIHFRFFDVDHTIWWPDADTVYVTPVLDEVYA